METYALYEGSFGRAVVLELRDDLVPHAHAETQLAFWLGGARVEGHVGTQVVPYGEHIALGTNAYEDHDARLLDRHAGPAVFLVLYISPAWLADRRATTGRAFSFTSPSVVIDDSVRHTCWRVLDRIVSPHHRDASVIDQEVEQLLLAAMVSADTEPRTLLRPRSSVLDHRLRSAISYMREHLVETGSVEEVAKEVGLSRGHLFQLFRDQLNTTPQVFWSAVRVEEAVRRLAAQKEPVTSVAVELGFSTPGNFSRFFREHMGVAPSRFRQAAASVVPHLLTGID
jgi:AraC-like DNA-binding protein